MPFCCWRYQITTNALSWSEIITGSLDSRGGTHKHTHTHYAQPPNVTLPIIAYLIYITILIIFVIN